MSTSPEPLVVIVGPGHPWADRASVSADELAGETPLGGEPASGTGTLLHSTFGADGEVAAGRLHSLALDGPPLRKTHWVSHCRALLAPDPAAAFRRPLRATDPHGLDGDPPPPDP